MMPSHRPGGQLRFLLYCHNLRGLGHIVRSLRIGAELAAEPRNQVRLITGCRFLHLMPIDPRIEVIHLPALQLGPGRRPVPVDGGSLSTALKARSRQIVEQVADWRPHAVLVDHNPTGLFGEVTQVLDANRAAAAPARFIWGVRDIWGSDDYVKMSLWSQGQARAGSRLDLYYGAMAYTDERWLDTFASYGGLPLPARRASVGIVTVPMSETEEAAAPVSSPLLVALSGGGAGAGELLDRLLEATGDHLADGRLRLRFVVGPVTGDEELRARCAAYPGVEVWPEGAVEKAIAGASLVISRAGYNSAYALVQTGLPLVFAPLPCESDEQVLRAARLAELDGVQNAGDRPCAGDLREAILRGLARGRAPRRLPFAIDGARRAAAWLREVAGEEAGA